MVNMKKSKVALIKCDTYDYDQVYDAIDAGIKLIGGITNFVKEGERILIKPNVLIGTNPEKCVCTHPSVFKAVAVILNNAKAIVSYGDSSGFGKSAANMKRAKLKQVADELGLKLADFDKGLYIMDGIIALEGNGPRSGKPKKLGVLLFSSDPVSIDAIACRIINLNPEYVPTSIPGERVGLGTYHYDNIEVIGEDIESVIDKDFEVVRKPPVSVSSGRLRKFIKN